MESPRRQGQSASLLAEDATLVSRARVAPDALFSSVLHRDTAPAVGWTQPDGPDLVGVGAAAVVSARGEHRFDAVRTTAADLFSDIDSDGVPDVARPRFVGGFAFHDDHRASDPWGNFPAAAFTLPKYLVTRTDDETWLTVTERGPNATSEGVERMLDREIERASESASAITMPELASTSLGTDRDAWTRQVTDAIDRIDAGNLRKVVLAQTRTATMADDVSAPDMFERLGETYPDCYRFLVAPSADSAFFGATPERLVARRGETVTTEALAGSAERGTTPAEDDELGKELRASEKIQREHGFVVDAVRDQLTPHATSVSAHNQEVRKLATVQHVRTPITAELQGDAHVLSLVEALHPTPAVGGLPPAEATRVIRETETFDRGWYAAPVGWFDAAGDGSFAVGIRSAVATGDTATLFAGNGIVADSDPDAEWTEVQLKYRAILDALAGGTS